MGGGGPQSQVARSLKGQHWQRKKCSVEKSNPTPAVLGVLRTQPEGSVPPPTHMSVYATEASNRSGWGVNMWAQHPVGRTARKPGGVGMAGARLRLLASPSSASWSPPLFLMPSCVLLVSCNIPADPHQDGPLRALQRPC